MWKKSVYSLKSIWSRTFLMGIKRKKKDNKKRKKS